MRNLFAVTDSAGDGYGLFAARSEAEAEAEYLNGITPASATFRVEAVTTPDAARTLAELQVVGE